MFGKGIGSWEHDKEIREHKNGCFQKNKNRIYQQQNSTKADSEGQREIFPERGAEVPVGIVSQEIGKFVRISK